uniref:Heat shock 70 kDa protein, mitochondrial n=1 Tax=Tanacetum cinerariifolium TaxID=118510 RepID=A0A6L2N2J3_TANCI|nr:heat shock 70 kDa protein, mitochondrial [Tanacetum cinerariifolium]
MTPSSITMRVDEFHNKDLELCLGGKNIPQFLDGDLRRQGWNKKEEQKQDQGGWKKKEGRVPKKRITYESMATTLSYGLNNKEGLIIVFHLGGGIYDVCSLELSNTFKVAKDKDIRCYSFLDK